MICVPRLLEILLLIVYVAGKYSLQFCWLLLSMFIASYSGFFIIVQVMYRKESSSSYASLSCVSFRLLLEELYSLCPLTGTLMR